MVALIPKTSLKVCNLFHKSYCNYNGIKKIKVLLQKVYFSKKINKYIYIGDNREKRNENE